MNGRILCIVLYARPIFKVVFLKPDGNPGWNVKSLEVDFETCEKFHWWILNVYPV